MSPLVIVIYLNRRRPPPAGWAARLAAAAVAAAAERRIERDALERLSPSLQASIIRRAASEPLDWRRSTRRQLAQPARQLDLSLSLSLARLILLSPSSRRLFIGAAAFICAARESDATVPIAQVATQRDSCDGRLRMSEDGHPRRRIERATCAEADNLWEALESGRSLARSASWRSLGEFRAVFIGAPNEPTALCGADVVRRRRRRRL